MSTDITNGYDTPRFYRRNTNPYLDIYTDNYDQQADPILVLTVALVNSPGEGNPWQVASGHFAIPNQGIVAEKAAAVVIIANAWDTNKNEPIATLLSAINSALTTEGYTRPDGSAIT